MNRFDPANQGLWVCGQRQEASTTSPTSKKRHRQKRTTDVLQKPDKSECYRRPSRPTEMEAASSVPSSFLAAPAMKILAPDFNSLLSPGT